MSTLNDVLNALNNPNVNMIGVYGMAGVGKTKLVKEAPRLAKKISFLMRSCLQRYPRFRILKRFKDKFLIRWV